MQPTRQTSPPAALIAGLPWDGFDAYLFDIDGTLLNCRDAVHYNAFHSALRQIWHCEHKIDSVPLHGNTDIGILRATAGAGGITEEEFSRRLPQALAILRAEVERHADSFRPEICPSIPVLLERLHGAGKLLGVTSGAIEPVGWAKLRAAGLARYFSFGSFSANARAASGSAAHASELAGLNESRAAIFRQGIAQVRSRLDERASICFLGDTPADIAAAKSLGTPILAVATGIFSFESLQEQNPELCLPCCDRLFASKPTHSPANAGTTPPRK
jgi:phosphoglycolate phosphatase-like HAD superfamily hydrolase